jgi:hypothetical protein
MWADPRIGRSDNKFVGAYIRMISFSADHELAGLIELEDAQRFASEDELGVLTDWGFITPATPSWVKLNGFRASSARSRRYIPQPIRRAVYERDGFECQHCGANEDLSLDHIHPYSLGGEDTAENLRVLCRSCNSKKGARVEQ